MGQHKHPQYQLQELSSFIENCFHADRILIYIDTQYWSGQNQCHDVKAQVEYYDMSILLLCCNIISHLSYPLQNRAIGYSCIWRFCIINWDFVLSIEILYYQPNNGTHEWNQGIKIMMLQTKKAASCCYSQQIRLQWATTILHRASTEWLITFLGHLPAFCDSWQSTSVDSWKQRRPFRTHSPPPLSLQINTYQLSILYSIESSTQSENL